MTAVLLGNFSVGAALPGAAALNTSLSALLSADIAKNLADSAALSLELPQVEANLATQVSLGASLSTQIADPSISLSAAASAIASGQTALSLAAAGPSLAASLSTQASANTTAQAGLTAEIAALNAKVAALLALNEALQVQLDLANALTASLSVGGIRVYLYTGPLRQIAVDLDALLHSPGGSGGMDLDVPVYVPILATDSTPGFEGLQAVIKTS